MAIELKDVLTYLGLDEKEVTDVDTFKSKFTGKFDTHDNFFMSDAYKAKKNEINGIILNMVVKEAKSNGIDVSDDVLKDESGKLKDNSEIIKTIFTKFNDNSKGTIEKVKSEYANNKDKGAKEWEEKYNLLNSKVKDLENINLTQKTEFEKEKGNYGNQVKQIKLQTKKEQLFNGLQFKKDITLLEKAGFTTIFETKYNLDLDDKGELFITDKAGARIPDTKTHNSIKKPEEILMDEAIANKVFQLNPSGGQPANNQTGINSFFQKREPIVPDPKEVAVLSDRARAAVGT